MIIAISTSSPSSSVALLETGGSIIDEAFEFAPMKASGAVIRLLDELLGRNGLKLSDADLFVSDAGPGSFTGVRVGVTIAKTLAWSCARQVAAVSAFDLITTTDASYVPARKGSFLIRIVGGAIEEGKDLPNSAVGYGEDSRPQTYPRASRASHVLGLLSRIAPMDLVPDYRLGPSISTPKQPYRVDVG